MTIRFLAYWNGYDAGAIATRADEAVLIAAGLAVTYISPDPTNQIVGYVYLTDAQLASLSAGVLGVIYETPTGWFRWDGAAFVATGTGVGGATLQSGALASNPAVAPNAAAVVTAVAAKADLQSGALSTSSAVAPNAEAVVNALAALPVDMLATTYATAIPLDKIAGREMGMVTIDANTTLTVAGSPAAVVNGNCNLTVELNGTHTLDLSAFTVRGDTIYNVDNNVYNIAFVKRPDAVYAYVSAGADALPTLLSATVISANADRIALLWSEGMNATLAAHTAFAVTGGTHALTAHTRVDATHSYLTTSTPYVPSESTTLDYAKPGTNNMQDLAGNEVAAFSGTAITDSVITGRADNFNRADENPIATPSDSGSNWLVPHTSGSLKVVSNTARSIADFGRGVAALQCSVADGSVQASIQIRRSGAPNAEAGLLIRTNALGVTGNNTGSDRNYIYFIWNSTAAAWQLTKRVLDTVTVVATEPTVPTNDATFLLRVEFTGTSIVCKVDGVTKFTETITELASNTVHGIWLADDHATNKQVVNDWVFAL